MDLEQVQEITFTGLQNNTSNQSLITFIFFGQRSLPLWGMLVAQMVRLRLF